jgi:metal-dependent amidase/aminoacylase/carboxypeptidase family protein
LIRDGVFNFASTGLVAKFIGTEAHAAYPEQGISPATALAEMILELTSLTQKFELDGLVTVVHARLGDVAFGTSPAYGEVMATLRSRDDDQLKGLTDEAGNLVTRIAHVNGLDAEVEWRDAFSTTYNHPEAVKVVERAALACNLEVERQDSPYRWSEDFGQFTARYPGALFGLGSGEHCPPLHSAAYDFPDELIETGVDIFSRIIDEVLGTPDR